MPHCHHQIRPRPLAGNIEESDEQVEREEESNEGSSPSEDAKEEGESNGEFGEKYQPRKEREVGKDDSVDEIAIQREHRMLDL